MTVVTRFPPSPTGFMHIGNARTALFNWLFARANGGKFLLRIEDTDRARHSEEAVQAILDGLDWLELDWDNNNGTIYSQYENRQSHIDVANELLAAGKAYKCFCTQEELEAMRESARAEGRFAVYDRRWRDRDPSDMPEGAPYVIRIKSPLEGNVTVDDRVQGPITLDGANLDDFILLRSDGSPTYMLSVVVDDHDMNVTHVIRGDDHINNCFRQNVIYDAMGWDRPVYAHLPLIHGPDGAKFSKRHGAQSVAEYRDMGFLPEAMRNYLLRLGWSHGDDEIIPTEKAIEWFNLENIGKSAARFDFGKLESLNAHYIRQADNARLLGLVQQSYEKQGSALNDTEQKRISSGLNDLKDRVKTLNELADEALFYLDKQPEVYDDKAQKTLQDGSYDLLKVLRDYIDELEDYDHETLENTFRNLAQTHGSGKLGKVIMPFRAALTGKTTSPPIFMAAEILGKTEVLRRVDAALAWINAGDAAKQEAV